MRLIFNVVVDCGENMLGWQPSQDDVTRWVAEGVKRDAVTVEGIAVGVRAELVSDGDSHGSSPASAAEEG